MIHEEAVEDAFDALIDSNPDLIGILQQRQVRAALVAAAPHMLTRLTNAVINRAYEDGFQAGKTSSRSRP